MSEKSALVLVVDDDSAVRESLKNLIRSAGFETQAFSSARDFLASARPRTPSCSTRMSPASCER